MLPQGTPRDLHLKCVSSLAPREALDSPSGVLKAGGRHPVFMAVVVALTTKALAPWAGSSATSWEGHGGAGRVSQARSKTEPSTTSCWQVAQAGCHVHENNTQSVTQLRPTLGPPSPPHAHTQTHTHTRSASLAKFHSLSPRKYPEKGARCLPF